MTTRDIIETVRRYGPSWAMSLALHLAILGPLCLITWAVGTAVTSETVITLAADESAPIAPEASGTTGADADGGGGDGLPAGAAGRGQDNKAPGRWNDAFAALPPAPPAMMPGETGETIPAMSQNGGPASGVIDVTDSLIQNLSGRQSGAPGGGGSGRSGDGPLSGTLAGTGEGFGRVVGEMRRKGLDVVLVLDATDSMTPYIDQAKTRLQQVMSVVGGMVGDVRFGAVAYKDYGDDYGPDAVNVLPLAADRQAVEAFIGGIIAGGGADEPEPINEAMAVVADVKKMGWAAGRQKVVILVGDSTIHSSGRQAAFAAARAIAKIGATINVVDVGGTGAQGADRKSVQPDLAQIAREGHGSAFLLTDREAFWRHLIVSVFGQQYEQDVSTIIDRYAKEP